MKAIAIFAVAAVIAMASVSLLAHQETFKGTVIAVASTNVRVNVVDSTTVFELRDRLREQTCTNLGRV